MEKALPSQTQPSVIVIDDDDTTRMMAMGFLSQAGFSVLEAEDGKSALHMIAQRTPDLIILDVEMPGMNGFEVCVELRNIPAFAHTPVLMFTGLENTEYIDKAYDAGATDFASKPINWSLLCHRLRYMHRASLASEQLLKEQARLADAQRIAQMGHWNYEFSTCSCEWSDQIYRILGVEPGNLEPSIANYLFFIHPQDKNRVQLWFSKVSQLRAITSIDHRLLLKDGSIKNVRQQLEPEFDSNGKLVGLKAIVQDFTERRRVERKVHQLAYYDTLTQLPNRVLFHDLLTIAMGKAKINQSQLAVLYFDLDDFKRVNDTFGHAVGDKLLHDVSKRLLETMNVSADGANSEKSSNIVARMGGDEFIIVLKNIDSFADAENMAELIIKEVSMPYRIDGYELFSSPSIGIAVYPKHGEEANSLLKNADMAMYEAKRTGKNMYMVHNDAMEDKAIRRYEIDAQMRSALENDEFSVNYQVQVDLGSGEIFSAEALVRWQSDRLGMVSPAEFIPVAEDNGLIVSIGEWVLRKSCHQAKSWMDSGFPIPRIAVNISVMQFMRSDFTEIVKRSLNESGLPAEKLELEITESLLASDINLAVETLRALHTLGVKLSVDDFGTGYSSLSQLKNFPIDRLKIDQSFIRNIAENRHDALITRTIIAMAKSMNIRVLAEGVETTEHFRFLLDNGCDEMQGYLISKPVSAEQLSETMPALLAQLAALFDCENGIHLKQAS